MAAKDRGLLPAIHRLPSGMPWPPPTLLPWRGRAVPHAVLDVGRGCDVACRACYNTAAQRWRPLRDLECDLDALRRARRLQAVTIAGGEPTLHPELCAIIDLVRSRGLAPVLLSNGRGLDERRVAALAGAGLAAALVHVDGGQQRDDAGAGGPALRAALAARLHAAGIAAGFQVIAYRSRLAEVVAVIGELLASPHAHHLLVTGCTDLAAFHGVDGTLPALRARRHQATPLAAEQVGMRELAAALRAAGLAPFAALPAADGGLRWLGASCIAVGRRRLDLARTPASPLLPHAARWLGGRFPFHLAPSPWRSRALALLASRTPLAALAAVAASLHEPIHHKVVLLQQGPRPRPDGGVSVCRDCPDATWRDGRLVPVCLSDRLEAHG